MIRSSELRAMGLPVRTGVKVMFSASYAQVRPNDAASPLLGGTSASVLE